MELLEFIFSSIWHFVGFLILCLAVLSTIEAIILNVNERNKIRIKLLENNIEQLKATIKKDREAIADYLNELTVKKNGIQKRR